MISHAEQRILEVDEVAPDVDRQDLPPAASGDLVAECVSVDQHAAVARGFPIPDDILARVELATGERQGKDRRTVVIAEGAP